MRSEVAYALDMLTGEARELHAPDRAYIVTESEIPGTADLVVIDDSGVVVWDFKTGQRLGPARRSYQLLHAAYCAAWIYASTRVAPPIIRVDLMSEWHAREMPAATIAYAYLSEDGVELDEAMIAPNEWGDVLEYLRGPWYEVAAAHELKTNPSDHGFEPSHIPDVHQGDHCQFCPAHLQCPATRTAVALIHGAEREQALLTPEELARTYRAMKDVRKVCDQIEAAARRAVQLGLLPGYHEHTITREMLDGVTAYQVLVEAHGEETARAACKVATSRAEIKDAIRKHSPHVRDGISDARQVHMDAVRVATRNAEQEIRARGGTFTRTHTVLREDRPQIAEHAPPEYLGPSMEDY